MVALIGRMRDLRLLMDVETHLRLVRYSPGRIEFEPTPEAPRDLAQRLGERLRGWTGGTRWAISVSSGGGGPTIAEARAAERAAAEAEARQGPLLQAVFAAFPEARIVNIRPVPPPEPVEAAQDKATSLLQGTEGPVAAVEEWDPFEDDE